MSLFDKAVVFATRAHRNQTRKYTGESYIMHPLAVAEIVRTVEGHTDEMLAAAVLHDVVEDCDVTIDEICEQFGTVVGMYVEYCTDISRPEHGNRRVRKDMDAWHYSRGPMESQTIKVADLIDNTADISKNDPGFWNVYKNEKWLCLNLLTKADPELWQRARKQLKELW